jgi:hypothetical protein
MSHAAGFMAIVELCGFNDWLLQMLALAHPSALPS